MKKLSFLLTKINHSLIYRLLLVFIFYSLSLTEVYAQKPKVKKIRSVKQITSAIDREIISNNSIAGYSFRLYDSESDELVLSYQAGKFQEDSPFLIASVTKIVTALTFMSIIDAGEMNLDDTTGEILGWQGNLGTITLRHLLSFTAGLKPQNSCINVTDNSLQGCVQKIYRQNIKIAKNSNIIPGNSYDYGATYMQVAAAMAEKKLNMSWNEIFTKFLKNPLSLSDDTIFTTLTSGTQVIEETQNPALASGLYAHIEDLIKVISAIDNDGLSGNQRIASASLINELLKNQFTPKTKILGSPLEEITGNANHGYGFGNFVDSNVGSTPLNIAPGGFGSTLFIVKGKFYGSIATYSRTKQINRINQSIDGPATITVNLLYEILNDMASVIEQTKVARPSQAR